ncbi:ABC transporter permease [Rhizobium paknamense]|uniref:Ribose transport system permease protein n=1 Tax=Rhizobium paknamense TaxID=1206817 RepID=A0ABU0IDE0_9HYPH|nr:ABC transporter permease [Rhizobium paknamense]MDQ0455648.1 ribose transport system permease protein [Rhizobium paknamense]
MAFVIVSARRWSAALSRYGLLLALVLVFAVFTLIAPTFATPANLLSILVNNFALLAIVSVAMTLAVAAGGIDLSVGTAIDFASFAFVSLVLSGYSVPLAIIAALLAGGVVGLFNAILISGIGVSPFLATLGTLFIGRSVQQLATNGGNPVYLPPNGVPDAFRFIGHGTVVGLPVPLLLALLVVGFGTVILTGTRFGRIVTAIGIQSSVVRYSGLGVGRTVAVAFIASGIIAALAGLVLTATVTVYIPLSGNAFLLNAIGATFIGTTLSPNRRPNVAGTAIGVLLLGIVANGLLISGLNFYWQQVGTGTLIFLVLAFSFVSRKPAAG